MRYASDVGRRSMVNMPAGESNIGSGELLDNRHLPDAYQMNSRGYHLVFVILI